MQTIRGAFMTFCVAATATGCATIGTGRASPPSHIVCSVHPMQPSQHGAEAQEAIHRTLVLAGAAATPYLQRALQAAEMGIAAQPDNPWHYILAGQAAAGLHQLTAAHRHFQRAEALCPEAVEVEILPARQSAWLAALDRGVARFQAGETGAAIRIWEEATMIWDGAPNAHFNLAVVHAGHDNLEAAVRHYRQALEIQGRMPPPTDRARAMERLETRAQIINGIMAAGAQHFQDNRYDQAANAFRDVTRIEPNSRDAWYNFALALYQLERWTDLEPVAERVVELDPLNYNARIILFNAYRGIAAAATPGTPAEREATARGLATLEAADALPVQIDGIALSGGVDTPVRIAGAATDSGQSGDPVTLEFAVYGAGGELGSAITTIERPGPDATLPFSVSIRTAEPVTGWRYRVR